MRYLFFIILFFNINLQANESEKYVITDSITVTADRINQNIMNINAAVAVISSESLNLQNPRSTPEALMTTSGVFVQKTNHGGGSPFVRGLTGQQTLILIDGIRLNNSTTRSGPNQYFNTIDPNILSRVEVLKGAGSVEYGSDAIGGTINVISDKAQFSDGDFKMNFDVLGRYMSNDMEKTISGKVKGGSENIAFLANFSYNDFGDLFAGGDTKLQSPSGYEQLSGALDLKFRTSLNSNINLSTQLLNQSEVPLFHKVELEDYKYNYFEPQFRNLNYVKFSGIGTSNNVIDKIFRDYSLTAFYINAEEGRISQKNTSSIRREETDKISTIGFTGQFSNNLHNNWLMTSGAEYYFDDVASSRNDINLDNNEITAKRGLYPDGSTYSNFALFNLHKLTYKNFIFDAGFRYNTYSIKVPEATLGNIEINPSAFVWKVGLARKFGANHLLGFNVNKAFRAPNIDDMGTLGIVDFRYEVPANDLKPESSINMELNYKLNFEKIWFEVSLYRNNLTDFISRVQTSINGQDSIDGYPIFIKQNAADSYIQGFETYIKYAPIEKMTLSAFISYTYGQNETDNEPMRRIPPINGMLALNYNIFDDFLVSGEFLLAGKQDRLAAGDISDNRIPEGGTEAWNVINFYFNYRFRNLSLNLGLINLTDEDYRYHGSGINMQGRSAKFTINYSLKIAGK